MSDSASASEHGCSAGPLEQCLESFATKLTSLGYSAAVVQQKQATATAFARWAVDQWSDIATIDDATIEAFLVCSGGYPTLHSNRRCALAGFLEHLRAEGAALRPEPERDHSYATLLQEHYETYLRSERGLAEGTIASYRLYVSEFIRQHFETTTTAPAHGLDAGDVRDFLLKRTRTLAPKTAQLVATALRSFLRFLFLQSETTLDLAFAIPTVPMWRQARVHPYRSPEEVELLLEACDRNNTASGRRDHAILLLLARLGVRACEVAALELGDLRWRSGEIVVRGKGQVLQCLPLLPDVGAALARYLRDGRPKSQCRSVFLRNNAPRVGLGPDGVGFVVRRALARARLHPPHRGSHLLRFSLATTMIRRGASMAEIGEVLRHHSHDTTEIYAKVDFAALRAVALPWVSMGGER